MAARIILSSGPRDLFLIHKPKWPHAGSIRIVKGAPEDRCLVTFPDTWLTTAARDASVVAHEGVTQRPPWQGTQTKWVAGQPAGWPTDCLAGWHTLGNDKQESKARSQEKCGIKGLTATVGPQGQSGSAPADHPPAKDQHRDSRNANKQQETSNPIM